MGYVLLPLVFGALDWKTATALFLPVPDRAPIAAGSALAQWLGLAYLLVGRWRERERLLDAPSAQPVP
jgi:hypothetical protein